MKLSEITKTDVIEYLKLESDMYQEKTAGERQLFAVMKAARDYILDYTGLTEEKADSHEQFYTAYMVLCQDMIDNRSFYVDKNNTNKVVESILDMHCENLL
ncbi:MAG: head-tail connector protein [Lachnospiraceae bacterium]|nr:head-tail connector protein [Lachnospiraceae bacterium]